MKTKLILFTLLSLNFCLLSSQVPQGLNYQALAGDASGNPIRNTELQVKISILSDTTLPLTIWEELHPSVRTNSYGIFSLVVGKGTRQPASTVPKFSDISWKTSQLYIRTQVYYQSVWKTMGAAKLWSVPYSMVADNLSGAVGKLSVAGTTAVMDEALFEVKNKNGQTVFAVYNEGVRVYIDDGAKSPKGGFAIGGFDIVKGNPVDYFIISPDSARIYVNNGASSKVPKGGFAIGGFDIVKGMNRHFLDVSTDATGIVNPSQNRILWYPIKNAFLAGKVLIENPDSVGINSLAIGYESKAIGQFSQALGFNSISRGDFATAIGKRAVANHINSFAFGDNAKALNDDSYAFGAFAEAKGVGSFAFGYAGRDSTGPTGRNTVASGNYSFAFGLGCEADSLGSVAFGSDNKASNHFSQAFGLSTLSSGHTATTFGYKTTASAWTSMAIGGGTVASGPESFAMGNESWADGWASSAFGNHSIAKGDLSFAVGNNTKASGKGSFTAGNVTIASGDNSVAFGCCNTEASGFVAMAIGGGTLASGIDAFAGGSGSQATNNHSFAFGHNTFAGGQSSFALGKNSRAVEDVSFAMGDSAIAEKVWSVAFGDRTLANAYASMACGVKSIAAGHHSFTFGQTTLASGNGSVAFGDNTTATSGNSFTAGNGNQSNGWGSVTFGTGTIANSFTSLVTGRFNDTTLMTNKNWYVPTDAAFTIGNGTSHSDRKNAFIVLQNGNTGIAMVNPQHKLDIAGGNGRVETGYDWLTNSDIHYKQNISTIENALEMVMNLRGVRFDINNDSEKKTEKGKHIGFIAQELETVVPMVVVTGADGYKSVAYDKLTAVLTEAIKEQQKQIEIIRLENKDLKSELDELKTLVNNLLVNQSVRSDN